MRMGSHNVGNGNVKERELSRENGNKPQCWEWECEGMGIDTA